MKSLKTVGFIGGGRITRILLQGFKNANVAFDKVWVYEPNETVVTNLKTLYPYIEASTSEAQYAASADVVFVALHPPVLIESLRSMANFISPNALVVSLAPKITIATLKTILPQNANIARMNPNAGTWVNLGYNPVCFAAGTDEEISTEVLRLFGSLGKVPVVDEHKIEAYAVISAMGHTYFWFQLQQMKELALSFGLSEQEAQETISAMLWGTTETLFNSGLSFEEVTNLVPVKPMADHEDSIKEIYQTCLNGIFQKIKPQ
jgi:pyrroline-5-carboxylate reductase